MAQNLRDMSKLFAQFQRDAMRGGKQILDMSPSERQKFALKKGLAGGEKFIFENIFFKLAVDNLKIYRGTQWAQKAAGQELRNLIELTNLNIPCLHLPLACIIDYLGHRLLALSILPINRVNTLVYGSDDGGRTFIARSKGAVNILAEIGAAFHLKPHTYQGNLVSTAVDLEVHRGTDDRLYVIDAARLFPPTFDSNTLRGGIFSQSFRPEFSKNYNVLLNADAFSGFSTDDPSHDKDEKEIRTATYHLKNQICERCSVALLENFSVLRKSNTRLVKFIQHEFGINIRFLKYLLLSLETKQTEEAQHLEVQIKLELIARAIKSIIFHSWRKIGTINHTSNSFLTNSGPLSTQTFSGFESSEDSEIEIVPNPDAYESAKSLLMQDKPEKAKGDQEKRQPGPKPHWGYLKPIQEDIEGYSDAMEILSHKYTESTASDNFPSPDPPVRFEPPMLAASQKKNKQFQSGNFTGISPPPPTTTVHTASPTIPKNPPTTRFLSPMPSNDSIHLNTSPRDNRLSLSSSPSASPATSPTLSPRARSLFSSKSPPTSARNSLRTPVGAMQGLKNFLSRDLDSEQLSKTSGSSNSSEGENVHIKVSKTFNSSNDFYQTPPSHHGETSHNSTIELNKNETANEDNSLTKNNLDPQKDDDKKNNLNFDHQTEKRKQNNEIPNNDIENRTQNNDIPNNDIENRTQNNDIPNNDIENRTQNNEIPNHDIENRTQNNEIPNTTDNRGDSQTENGKQRNTTEIVDKPSGEYQGGSIYRKRTGRHAAHDSVDKVTLSAEAKRPLLNRSDVFSMSNPELELVTRKPVGSSLLQPLQNNKNAENNILNNSNKILDVSGSSSEALSRRNSLGSEFLNPEWESQNENLTLYIEELHRILQGLLFNTNPPLDLLNALKDQLKIKYDLVFQEQALLAILNNTTNNTNTAYNTNNNTNNNYSSNVSNTGSNKVFARVRKMVHFEVKNNEALSRMGGRELLWGSASGSEDQQSTSSAGTAGTEGLLSVLATASTFSENITLTAGVKHYPLKPQHDLYKILELHGEKGLKAIEKQLLDELELDLAHVNPHYPPLINRYSQLGSFYSMLARQQTLSDVKQFRNAVPYVLEATKYFELCSTISLQLKRVQGAAEYLLNAFRLFCFLANKGPDSTNVLMAATAMLVMDKLLPLYGKTNEKIPGFEYALVDLAETIPYPSLRMEATFLAIEEIEKLPECAMRYHEELARCYQYLISLDNLEISQKAQRKYDQLRGSDRTRKNSMTTIGMDNEDDIKSLISSLQGFSSRPSPELLNQYIHLAKFYILTEQFENAHAAVVHAQAILKKLLGREKDEKYAQFFLVKGELLYSRHQFANAEWCWNKGLEFIRKHHANPSRLVSYADYVYSLTKCYSRLKDAPQFGKFFKHTVDAFNEQLTPDGDIRLEAIETRNHLISNFDKDPVPRQDIQIDKLLFTRFGVSIHQAMFRYRRVVVHRVPTFFYHEKAAYQYLGKNHPDNINFALNQFRLRSLHHRNIANKIIEWALPSFKSLGLNVSRIGYDYAYIIYEPYQPAHTLLSCTPGFFLESEKKKIFLEIVNGVRYLHQNKVCHFNLCLENILYSPRSIKITGFELSQSKEHFKGLSILNPWNAPPEFGEFFRKLDLEQFLGVLFKNYNYSVPDKVCWDDLLKFDIYSLGIIFWEILNGESIQESLPGTSSKLLRVQQVRKLIDTGATGKVSFKRPFFQSDNVQLSSEFSDLLEEMLHTDPKKRPDIEKVFGTLNRSTLTSSVRFVPHLQTNVHYLSHSKSSDSLWSNQGEILSDIVVHTLDQLLDDPKVYQQALENKEPPHNVLEWLVRTRMDPNQVIKGLNQLPLHVAARAGNVHGVQMLAQAMKNFNARHPDTGQNVAFYALQADLQTLELVIELGVNLNLQDQNGNTPLHFCVANKKTEMLQLLAKHKPDVLIKNLAGKTPADLAKELGLISILPLLRNY